MWLEEETHQIGDMIVKDDWVYIVLNVVHSPSSLNDNFTGLCSCESMSYVEESLGYLENDLIFHAYT